MLKTTENLRHIKSFVLRQGKITAGQENAVKELLPIYGITYDANKKISSTDFGNDKPIIIEIGFGMGHATWQIAKNNPQYNYLCLEVHSPGVGSLLIHMKENGVENIRIVQHDAVEVLRDMIADNSIAGFNIFFPDPWHKKRHHKRRLLQSEFVATLVSKLQVNGFIHLATDWEDYAFWSLDIFRANTDLLNQSLANDFMPRPEWRPLTKFENRGINLGHGVWDLTFRKNEK